jgi:hypothetical protein
MKSQAANRAEIFFFWGMVSLPKTQEDLLVERENVGVADNVHLRNIADKKSFP